MEDLSVISRTLSARDKADDVDRLPQPPDRPGVRHAVPALDDLRPADSEPQQEAPAGHRGQRHRRHRRVRRSAADGLKDAAAQLDAGGLGGEVGQRRRAVVAPGLGRPDAVDADAFGLEDVAGKLIPVFVRVQGGGDGGVHDGILLRVIYAQQAPNLSTDWLPAN